MFVLKPIFDFEKKKKKHIKASEYLFLLKSFLNVPSNLKIANTSNVLNNVVLKKSLYYSLGKFYCFGLRLVIVRNTAV